MAKILNLMGLGGAAGWTNANEDTAGEAGNIYRSHAANMQQPVTDAATHGQRATTVVEGPAGEAMTAAINHPQGPVKNLTDHHRGALAAAFIAGGIVPPVLTGYKMLKIIDGVTTIAEMTASAVVPGGEIAWPEELAVGRLAQNAITNAAADVLMSG